VHSDDPNEQVTPTDLRRSALFDGFGDDELATAAELGTVVHRERGELLTDQGRVGLECFIILEGSASVYVGDDFVTTVGAGATVGEMALLGHRPRSATVVVDAPVRAAAFDLTRFRALLDEFPEARARIEALVAERAALLQDVRRSQQER
jgi:CRP-like cAMP-binding protein